ncbi:MAG: universal stress protein [Deltaproteobacteria bacterium]|nr:universal stress protein [Deltaproteobacteria bacterium]
MFPLKKILCPVDFSEPSHHALKIAVEMARQFGAALNVIHVIPPVPVHSPYPDPPNASSDYEPLHQQELALESEESLKNMIRWVPKEIPTLATVVTGDAAEEILAFAAKEHINLIVIATHGLTGWRHLITGSVTEKIVRQASCPVLTIRPPAGEKQEK